MTSLASKPRPPAVRGFSYDDWSNMYVSATRVMSPASFTPTSSTNFNTANRLLIQTSAYDLAGNQTAIGGFTFAYDHEGRVKTSTLNSIQTNYTYDGNGRRVTKSTGGSTTTFVYDASGNLAAEYGGTVTETGARYLTADHLGSTRLVTKDDGTPDRRIDYLPFGEFMPATVGGRTTAMKYEATETLAALTQRFTGKERDAETGLDYFGARYLSSAQGKFTSTDPVIVTPARMVDPQRFNVYSYARNNPFKFIDPTGEDIEFVNDTEEGRKKALALITKNMSAKEAANIGIRKSTSGSFEAYLIDKKAFGKDASAGHRRPKAKGTGQRDGLS